MVSAALLFCATAVGSAQAAAHPKGGALQARLHQALAAGQRGDVRGALALTHNLLAESPGYVPALKLQGLLLEQSGQAAEAAGAYKAALKLAPQDGELLVKVGTLALVAGDHDEAIQLFTRRLKQAPRDGETLYYLAQAYHLKDNNDLALETIKRGVEADPKNVLYWQKYGELLCSSGDNEAALRWLRKAQSTDPTLDRIAFDLGVASYKNEDLENAAQYAGKAVELHPRDLKALALLAEIDVKLAKWDEAKPLFEHILTVHAEEETALLGLGHCQLSLKQYAAAAETLERLLVQDPTLILAHFYLSRAYTGLGRTADAQHEGELHSKLLEQAASTVPIPERKIEKATLVEARELLTEHREAQAVQLFREHSKGPTATPGAPYMLVGVVYLYMGKQAEAQRCLKQSLQVEPSVRGAHTYLGILALEDADLEKAEGELQAELAGEPNYQLAVAELGELRYRQGHWEEAVKQFSNSRTVDPRLLYMLSDSYFHLGKINQADLTAELVVDYAKKDPSAVQAVVTLLNQNGQTDLAQRLAGR